MNITRINGSILTKLYSEPIRFVADGRQSMFYSNVTNEVVLFYIERAAETREGFVYIHDQGKTFRFNVVCR